MPYTRPDLNPISQTTSFRLPSTGDVDNVVPCLPFKIYSGSAEFISGAVEQVTFVYNKLSGEALNIELSECQVYSAYEESVLEYSYLVNIHQAKNSLGNLLGQPTGTFDRHGELLDGSNAALKYPKYTFAQARKVADAVGNIIAVGGSQDLYSASIELIDGQQDYDLQAVVAALPEFSGSVGNKKIDIQKVFYLAPKAIWRFYGYYGGINTIGNLSSYGMFADDSTFEVVPTWQNKLQHIAYKDSLRVRTSNYSYEIHNNKLRIYPIPWRFGGLTKIWFQFSLSTDPIDEDSDKVSGVNGVNNMNTAPFSNIPYENINSIGRNWCRRFSLALCKEMLGQTRGKLKTIPIPGNDVTLNADELLSQAKEEMKDLREELKTVLDELTYAKISEQEAAIAENTNKTLQQVPTLIFVG